MLARGPLITVAIVEAAMNIAVVRQSHALDSIALTGRYKQPE
jgi:hypothetical protein